MTLGHADDGVKSVPCVILETNQAPLVHDCYEFKAMARRVLLLCMIDGGA